MRRSCYRGHSPGTNSMQRPPKRRRVEYRDCRRIFARSGSGIEGSIIENGSSEPESGELKHAWWPRGQVYIRRMPRIYRSVHLVPFNSRFEGYCAWEDPAYRSPGGRWPCTTFRQCSTSSGIKPPYQGNGCDQNSCQSIGRQDHPELYLPNFSEGSRTQWFGWATRYQ